MAICTLALVSLPAWSQSDAPAQDAPKVETAQAPEKAIILRADKADGDTGDWVAQPGSGSERDRRIERLEEQLQELLKEVQALRGGGAKLPREVNPTTSGKTVERRSIIIDQGPDWKQAPAPGTQDKGKPATKFGTAYDYAFPKQQPLDVIGKRRTENGMTLSRAVYLLPHVQAEALAMLLSEHSRIEVLETRVEGDRLMVTTIPEAQDAIRQFLSLLGTTSKISVDKLKLHVFPGTQGKESTGEKK